MKMVDAWIKAMAIIAATIILAALVGKVLWG
jgi:hypothetical protein